MRGQQAQTQKARAAEAAQFISLALTFNQGADLDAFAKRVTAKPAFALVQTVREILMIAALRTLDGGKDPIHPQPTDQ